jgi:hypothetical protein
MLNHATWTAAAELTHRVADPVQQRRQTGVAARKEDSHER